MYPTLKKSSDDLLSHAVTHAVPSALKGLTSVVGMETGDPLRSDHWTPSAHSPRWPLSTHTHTPTPRSSESRRARSISICLLHLLPHVHSKPIYLVISQEPSEGVATLGRSHLEGGFPLRCFLRFSRPHVATQRCPWRNNWYTSGVSIPVLSY